jgi:hypothetical protein
MEPTTPKGIRVRRHDHDTLQKDFSPETSDIDPEILSDPIIQQQFRNFGYAIIQIGDRLVRVYGNPTEKPDKRVLGDATPGQQPEAYVGIQPGVDSRYEMSAWDNLERGRNAAKAMMRFAMSKSQPLDEETKKVVNRIVKNSIHEILRRQGV